jgi:hypothetical protein
MFRGSSTKTQLFVKKIRFASRLTFKKFMALVPVDLSFEVEKRA